MPTNTEESQPNWRNWYTVLALFLVGIILFFIGFSTIFG